MSKLQELIDAYSVCINQNRTVVSQLRTQIRKIEAFKEKCAVAKTVGTVANVAGGISLLAAPFTGGLSLLVTGAIATGAGLTTNLITDYINSSETKDFIKGIEKFNESRKGNLERLAKLQAEFQQNVQTFKGSGLSEEHAQTKAIMTFAASKTKVNPVRRRGGVIRRNIAENVVGAALASALGISFFKTANAAGVGEMMQALHALDQARRAAELAQALKTAELLANAAKAANALKVAEVGVTVGEVAGTVTKVAVQAGAAVGKTAGSATATAAETGANVATKAGGAALRTVGTVMTVGFIAIDVALLIREWTSTNAAATYATKVITLLREEEEAFLAAMRHLLALQESLSDAGVQVEVEVDTDVRVATQTATATATTTEEALESSSSEEECTCRYQTLSVYYLNIQSMRLTPNNQSKRELISQYIATQRPNIIVFVETWLTPADSTENIKAAWNLGEYLVFRYDRGVLGNDVERERERGGGTLVAWNFVRARDQNLFFTEEDMELPDSVSRDTLRFFCISKYFRCQEDSCEKVDARQMWRDRSTKCYTLCTVYRRGDPFRESATQRRENRRDFNEANTEWLGILQDFFGGDLFNSSRAAGVLIGDFNWNEREWVQQVEEMQMSTWTRIPISGPTYTSGPISTCPDGVIAFPREFVWPQPIPTVSCGTPHSALAFTLRLGKDYNEDDPCEKCFL